MRYPEDFETAQEVRDVLERNNWVPLTKIHAAEHWVKGGKRCVLIWNEDEPEKVPPLKWSYICIRESSCACGHLVVEHYPRLFVSRPDRIKIVNPGGY